MNPMDLFQLRPLLQQFRDRHPKFVQFFSYAGKNLSEGSLVEMSITSPEGKKIVTNIRISPEDVALYSQLQSMLHT